MDATGTPGGGSGPGDAGPGADTPARGGPSGPDWLRGAEAAKTHLTLAVGLAICVAAFWFELDRALAGNGLSWAYVFEWPLFAVFAVYMWWNVLHGDRAVRRRRAPRPEPALDPRYAGMLEAWEAHQRKLQASRAETEDMRGAGDGAVGGGGRAGRRNNG